MTDEERRRRMEILKLEGLLDGRFYNRPAPPSSPEPIGHWEIRTDITIVHWPTKGHEFPHACRACDQKILEASA